MITNCKCLKVTDNHFVGDFIHLDEEDSCFEITVELSFEDGEFVFDELLSWINDVIELASHFLAVSSTDNLVVP